MHLFALDSFSEDGGHQYLAYLSLGTCSLSSMTQCTNLVTLVSTHEHPQGPTPPALSAPSGKTRAGGGRKEGTAEAGIGAAG